MFNFAELLCLYSPFWWWQLFREIAEVSGDDRRNILLANYIELAVNSIVGVASTAAYLTALVEC